MKTGFAGTFVIPWSQTEIDGLEAPSLSSISEGAAWSWRGDALRVDGPNDVLQLTGATGPEQLRARASRMVRKLVGQAFENGVRPEVEMHADDNVLNDHSFSVADGVRSFIISVIETGPATQPLLMFVGQIPPRHTDLWIVAQKMNRDLGARSAPDQSSVICFAQGTRISTPDGPRQVEDLRPGDLALTKDNGPQTVRWVGMRKMTGARLHAMPFLRPIRFGPGALGVNRPEDALWVSPNHRLLIKGPAALALFNTDEVLVAARDLVNGKTIRVAQEAHSVTYVHLMFEAQQVIWANGVESESFHPANADLSMLRREDHATLLQHCPDIVSDPYSYGAPVRRNLSKSEAALLRYAA